MSGEHLVCSAFPHTRYGTLRGSGLIRNNLLAASKIKPQVKDSIKGHCGKLRDDVRRNAACMGITVTCIRAMWQFEA